MRNSGKIPGTMRVRDVVALLPGAATLLAEYGLPCSGCLFGGQESLEEGCRLHGFSTEKVDDLLSDLSALFQSLPPSPSTLTITNDAARALEATMTSQGGRKNILCVGLDDDGRFCLTSLRRAPPDAMELSHGKTSSVRIVTIPLLLHRIGGATLDYREGRFTLDLPKQVEGCR